MSKKAKARAAGAPAWMVTFGDMMSLLLCFFVILVALSEVKEDKFMVLVNSFQRYFGYQGSTGQTSENKYNDVFHRLEALRSMEGDSVTASGAEIKSLAGKALRVTSYKKGERLILSGDVAFDLGSSELKPAGKKVLDHVAELIRGYRNRIEIISYVSEKDNVDDPYQLSWDRSGAVLDYLVYKGIVRKRLLSVGAGLTKAGRRGSLDDPRRVDILVTEEIVRMP